MFYSTADSVDIIYFYLVESDIFMLLFQLNDGVSISRFFFIFVLCFFLFIYVYNVDVVVRSFLAVYCVTEHDYIYLNSYYIKITGDCFLFLETLLI